MCGVYMAHVRRAKPRTHIPKRDAQVFVFFILVCVMGGGGEEWEMIMFHMYIDLWMCVSDRLSQKNA